MFSYSADDAAPFFKWLWLEPFQGYKVLEKKQDEKRTLHDVSVARERDRAQLEESVMEHRGACD